MTSALIPLHAVRRRCRWKNRIAGAAGKNDDAAFFEVADCAATDERLGYLVHLDGGLHSSVHILFFERVLEGQGIDDGGQHSHVIGGNAVPYLWPGRRRLGRNCRRLHDCDLNAEAVDVRKFGGDFVDAGGVDSKALLSSESFT